MYLLSWDADDRVLFACFGGRLTAGEAKAFVEDLRDVLEDTPRKEFAFVMDLAKAKTCRGSWDQLESARNMAIFAGATQITAILPSQDEVHRQTNARLQHVLEGRESYRAAAKG